MRLFLPVMLTIILLPASVLAEEQVPLYEQPPSGEMSVEEYARMYEQHQQKMQQHQQAMQEQNAEIPGRMGGYPPAGYSPQMPPGRMGEYPPGYPPQMPPGRMGGYSPGYPPQMPPPQPYYYQSPQYPCGAVQQPAMPVRPMKPRPDTEYHQRMEATVSRIEALLQQLVDAQRVDVEAEAEAGAE